MHSKLKTWFLLAATIIPTLMWVVAITCFMLDVSDGVMAAIVAVLFMGAPLARIGINLGWIMHVLMSKDVDQVHKIFWAIGFLLEAFGSWCLGSLSVLGIIYWYQQVYVPYRDEAFRQSMRDDSAW